jgi:primosomal protein N' (replication factor Y)
VFHADEGRLHCHICSYTEFPPSICPNCRSNQPTLPRVRNQTISRGAPKHFPHANIARIDRDEARKVLRHNPRRC